MTFQEYLHSRDACWGAVKWVGRRGLRTAWRDCKRGDWMLWLIEEGEEEEIQLVPTRAMVEISIEVAACVLRYVSPGEYRPHEWLDAAIAYLDGRGSAFACGGAGWNPLFELLNTPAWAMAAARHSLESARVAERLASPRQVVAETVWSAWSMERALVRAAPTDELAASALRTGRLAQAEIIRRIVPPESLPRRLPSAKEVSSKRG